MTICQHPSPATMSTAQNAQLTGLAQTTLVHSAAKHSLKLKIIMAKLSPSMSQWRSGQKSTLITRKRSNVKNAGRKYSMTKCRFVMIADVFMCILVALLMLEEIVGVNGYVMIASINMKNIINKKKKKKRKKKRNKQKKAFAISMVNSNIQDNHSISERENDDVFIFCILCYIYIEFQLTNKTLMNSQQLLKSLNKESHRNHLSKSAIIESSSPQSPAMLGNQFVPHVEMEQMSDPPEYFVEMLNHQRKKKIVSQLVSDAIQKARKKRERNAYLLFGQGQEGYLGQLAEVLENKNQFSYKWVSQAITKRQQKVNGELQNGGLIVQRDRAIKKKSQIQVLEEFDRARLVKIKEGNIRSKLDYLNTKLEQMDKIDNLSNSPKQDKNLLKKAEEHIFSEYRLSSQKTKIAQDYIKHMAEQRRRRENRERKRSEKQRRQEDKRVMEIKQAQVLKQKQKREGIVNRMLFRKKKREDEEKQITERQEKVEKFLSAYRKQKPLFEKINDSYEKQVGKSQRYHEEKLKQIKEKKKSYSLNDITDHQKKYVQMKKKQNEKKSQQLQMYLKSLKANNKKYFRGSIHEVVEMVDKEAKQKDVSLYEIGKGKTNRRSQYSKRVRDEHKPKIDDQKKKQLLKAIEAEELKKKKLRKIYRPIEGQNGQEVGLKSYYQQIKNADAKKEGIKFLEYAKMKKRKYIEEQSQQEQEQTVNALKQQQSQKEKHTDSDLWGLRAKYIQQISHQISSPKQFEQLKVNFENLDDKAAKKEQILKHSNMTMEEYLHQKNALDHFYLESIKNKMKWLQ